MKCKVFVDGQEGTTGLKINDYLAQRDDLEILKIPADSRKDQAVRREFLNAADMVFLCLPDSAAREAVALIDNQSTRVLDASTAHRIHPKWVYGLAELNRSQRRKIADARRVAVPGCHATGFVLLVQPLIQRGILDPAYPVSCQSLTGYSGGGKSLIKAYEEAVDKERLNPPRPYALKLQHKHLPEMRAVTGLAQPPVFQPVVGNYYQGMGVSVPLLSRRLNTTLSAAAMRDFLAEYYAGERFVRVMPFADEEGLEDGFMNVETCNGTNRVDLFVFGHEEQILLFARFDNLGKGASGAAIQNFNIMLGLDEGLGLKA
ncbi:MAG TPA: N-acetyl-gamma-glutamyl-phosphate reductase [Patescibacteria group bacterium]|nr:N-acetyl-gamma-glutamyl-phosphate reductase [Patescibacteria group bacterium]